MLGPGPRRDELAKRPPVGPDCKVWIGGRLGFCGSTRRVWFGCCLLEVGEFGVGEEAEFADAEASVGYFADASAFERFDGQADFEEHPANLAVKTLGNRNLDKRAIEAAFEYLNSGLRCFSLS